MPFQSKRQQRWAFSTGQPFAERWAKQTRFAGLPEKKDAGAQAHGPGGLISTPGMGVPRKGRKYGKQRGTRTKAANYSARAGQTIVGNLRRGGSGRFESAGGPSSAPVARGIQLSKQPKLTAPRPQKPPGGGKGRAKRGAAAKPKKTEAQRAAEQAQKKLERQQERTAQQAKNTAETLQKLNIAPDGQQALEALRRGEQPDAEALARGGFEKAGMIEQADDGSYRLTASGRALLSAAAAGDAGRAGDIISGARDRTTARTERQAAAAGRKQQAEARRAAVDARRQAAAKKKKGGDTAALEAAMTQRTKAAGSPGDFLIVEDPKKSSTWHLQVKRNGTPDHGLMGSAWAALHSGFRGNVYQGPGKTAAIGKLKALYRSEKMDLPSEKSFTVFKDASGKQRWILRTSTAFRDRDGEVITTKAQEDDAARMTATGQYGPLRYWHIGQPNPFDPVTPWGPGLDLGMCDYSTVLGRTRIESGTFYSDAVGQAIAGSADEYEGSPGFFHALDQPDAGAHFYQIRGFERSLVPTHYARASNLFTGLAVGKATKSMNQDEYNRRVAVFLADMAGKGVAPEVAGGVIAQQQAAEKDADEQRIAYKSEDALPSPPEELTINGIVYALKAAPSPPEEAPAVETQADGMMAGNGMDMASEPEGDEGGNYVGDMSPEEFSALLTQAFTTALQPLAGLLEIEKKMAAHVDSVMGGYKTKDDARATELAALKTQQQQLADKIAAIEGDQPAVVLPDDVAAALKSAGPQTPPDLSQLPQIPEGPGREWAGLAARMLPELYGGAPTPPSN
jgi:hypothetical protein